MSMKDPLTPAGIEPATFRSVAQYLSHCATAVPHLPITRFFITFPKPIMQRFPNCSPRRPRAARDISKYCFSFNLRVFFFQIARSF